MHRSSAIATAVAAIALCLLAPATGLAAKRTCQRPPENHLKAELVKSNGRGIVWVKTYRTWLYAGERAIIKHYWGCSFSIGKTLLLEDAAIDPNATVPYKVRVAIGREHAVFWEYHERLCDETHLPDVTRVSLRTGSRLITHDCVVG